MKRAPLDNTLWEDFEGPKGFYGPVWERRSRRPYYVMVEGPWVDWPGKFYFFFTGHGAPGRYSRGS